MLVLQRKKGQTLLVGDNIKISIIDIGADGVKLAIDAPRDVKILREELSEAMKTNEQSVVNKEKISALKNLLKTEGFGEMLKNNKVDIE